MNSVISVGLAYSVQKGLLLLILGAMTMGSTTASPRNESVDLVRSTVKSSKASAPAGVVPGRIRGVEVNPRVLERSSFDVTLFPGETLRVERDRVSEMGGGDRVWSGRIAGEPLSRATFAVRNGVLSGVIDRAMDTGSVLYEISPNGRGGHVLFERDNSAPAVAYGESIEVPPPIGRVALPAAVVPVGGVHIVDLMIVYSPASRTRYGVAGIESKILTAVADANSAMVNSAVAVRFSLVHFGEVAYLETGKMTDALMALARTTDGIIDEVHPVRDAVGADIVVMIDEDTSGAGISYLMSIPSSAFAANAFAVVYSGALASLSMNHELGHLFGANHDRASAIGLAAFPYAYGWRGCDPSLPMFRTLMAYACGSAIRINYLSNPRLSYAGLPLGMDYDVDPDNAADNARVVTETAGFVAGFRASAATSAPVAPTGLVLTALAFNSVTLNWVDVATDEVVTIVERTVDGTTWEMVATLGVNEVGYTDCAVVPEGVYGYRVSAVNSAGASAYSDELGVNVPARPAVPASPTGLSAVLVGGAVTLTWVDASTDETAFLVERSASGGPFEGVATVAANGTGYMDRSVSEGLVYGYRVSASNALGTSVPTVTATVVVPLTAPMPASALVAVAGNASVTVTWTDNAANEASYRLERSVNGGSFLLWIVLGANTTGYVDTAVTAGSTYSYRVVAANGVGYSTPSNAGMATIPVPVGVPAAPSSLVRTMVTRTSIAIGWVDNATNETGFHVERSTNRSTWRRVATLEANSRGYNSTGLESNTSYYFRVRAFNTVANSAYTATLMVKTLR